jgi:hypothetical protein
MEAARPKSEKGCPSEVFCECPVNESCPAWSCQPTARYSGNRIEVIITVAWHLKRTTVFLGWNGKLIEQIGLPFVFYGHSIPLPLRINALFYSKHPEFIPTNLF